MRKGHVILKAHPSNWHDILFNPIYEKFETRSTKFETNTNVQNSKFKTSGEIQISSGCE